LLSNVKAAKVTIRAENGKKRDLEVRRIARRRRGHKMEGLRRRSGKIVAENCTVVHLHVRVAIMNANALPAYVLQALAQAQSEGRKMSLETLTEALRVRRGDVRRAVSLLHRQGFVDALRMRLTLPGFALGRAYLGQVLPPLRRSAGGAAETAAA
jgi:hypothetical protein